MMEGKGKWANYPNALASTKDQLYTSVLTMDAQEHQFSFFFFFLHAVRILLERATNTTPTTPMSA